MEQIKREKLQLLVYVIMMKIRTKEIKEFNFLNLTKRLSSIYLFGNTFTVEYSNNKNLEITAKNKIVFNGLIEAEADEIKSLYIKVVLDNEIIEFENIYKITEEDLKILIVILIKAKSLI